MKLFAFAASLRQGSLNQQLLAHAISVAQHKGAMVTSVGFDELITPNFNADDDVPQGALRFRELLEAHDGFLLASPEYNYSFPGNLKNSLDWVSRYRPVPLRGKHAFLLSASPSLVGGNRGLWSLQQPLTGLGVHVFPDMFSLASAHTAYHEDGTLESETLQQRLEHNLGSFLNIIKNATHAQEQHSQI